MNRSIFRLFSGSSLIKMAVNRDSVHLKLGDPQPPLKKGLLRLYNMRFCPYAQRVILVLDAKNIPYDTVNCNLVDKPAWLFEKCDGAKVPAIEFEDGQTLSESLILADYFDEVNSKPPLYPADPLAKAIDRRFIDAFNNNFIPIFFKMLIRDGEFTEKNLQDLLEKLTPFEQELTKRGSVFYGGSSPGMLDFMIWPFIERVPLMELRGGEAYKIPADRFPNLLRWIDAMLANPIVKLSALSPKVHQKYLECRKNGIFDFDRSHL